MVRCVDVVPGHMARCVDAATVTTGAASNACAAVFQAAAFARGAGFGKIYRVRCALRRTGERNIFATFSS